MDAISPSTNYGIANIIVPKGGPKAVPATLDFSNTGEILISGQQLIDQNKIEYIQGVFIDNKDNDVALEIEVDGIGQIIKAKGRTQGYYAIMTTNPPKMTARMTQAANRKCKVIFYNVPIQSHVWATA